MRSVVKLLAIGLLALLAYLVLIGNVVVTYLANVPVAITDSNATRTAGTVLFVHDTSYFTWKYKGSFEPSEWMFVFIWPVIFVWNFIGFTYIVISLFLNPHRSVIKSDPPLASPGFLFMSLLSFGCSLSWLFLHDRQYSIPAIIMLILACWTSYGMLAFLYIADVRYYSDVGYKDKVMVNLTRVLVHNGVAIWATFGTVMWLVQMIVMVAFDTINTSKTDTVKPRDNLSLEDGGTIVLSILMFKLIVWFVLENSFFEKYCRYTLTVYPTLFLMLAGCYTRLAQKFEDEDETQSFYPSSRNQIMTLVALCLTALAFIVRIPLVIYHHKNRIAY